MSENAPERRQELRHPYLLRSDGTAVPLTDADPDHLHLQWIKTNTTILRSALDEIESIYRSQHNPREAARDIDSRVWSFNAKKLDDYHDIRVVLIREGSQYLPKVRISALKNTNRSWRWGHPMPDKAAFTDELESLEHEANLRLVRTQKAAVRQRRVTRTLILDPYNKDFEWRWFTLDVLGHQATTSFQDKPEYQDGMGTLRALLLAELAKRTPALLTADDFTLARAAIAIIVSETGRGAAAAGRLPVKRATEILSQQEQQQPSRSGQLTELNDKVPFVPTSFQKSILTVKGRDDQSTSVRPTDSASRSMMYPAEHYGAKYGLTANRLDKARRAQRLRHCEKRSGRWFYDFAEVRTLFPDAVESE